MPSKHVTKSASDQQGEIRLQRFLAQAGLGSRRKCETFISEGRVSIDGKTVSRLGVVVDPATQVVRVDGERIRREPKHYFLLNKPAGYLCTQRDPQGRPRVLDLLPDGSRLFTVGRLDENSTGLLLATNDGELANRLAHPRYQIERRYQVQVAGKPTRETLQTLKQGLHFTHGRFRVRGIKALKSQGKSSFLEIVLTEGQNREIRRMLARVGHKVMKLKRVGFGPLNLGRLAEGRYRPLKVAEWKALKELVRESKEPVKKSPPKRRRRKSSERTPAQTSARKQSRRTKDSR